MKGILLAGGLGTRLYPSTLKINKQLLPVYDKPMIYYPLCTLLNMGIRDILVITTPHEEMQFKALLGDGSDWGIALHYAIQPVPGGIAEAFIVAENFIGHDTVCLILGDNILYGSGLTKKLQQATLLQSGAIIFSYYVADPERYGVVVFDRTNQIIDLVEKPTASISNYAVIGLYFYDNDVIQIAKSLKPSARRELEITDVSLHYLHNKKLQLEKLSRGITWLDTGTHQSLLEAANFIHVVEKRQGLKIGSPEEVAWRMGYIDAAQLQKLAEQQLKSGYGEYLLTLLN